MTVNKEVNVFELPGGKPLAEEAVTLCEQLSQPGIIFPTFYPTFAHLGVELLQHARSRTEPIDRNAFLRKREGVKVKNVLGGAGDVLGWTFQGEVDTKGGTTKVEVARTDVWSGGGVATSMKVIGNEGTLQMKAEREGGLDVVYLKKGGKKQRARFKLVNDLRSGQATLQPVL